MESARHPKLVVTPAGTLYLLAVGGNRGESRLRLGVSHDGGDTFMAPVAVSEADARVSSHGQNSPSLAVRPTEIYALWEQHEKDGPDQLMFARSLSFGHSFERPIRVTSKSAPSFNGFSTMGVAPNGDVYVAWLDGRDMNGPQGTFSVYVAKSADRGGSFGASVRVAQGACPCCRPALGFGADGEVFVVWRNVFQGEIRDMVMASSRDGGATFGAPVRVAEDGWRLSACPESGPAVAVEHGKLHVVWYSEGSNEPGLRMASSADGRTFSKPVMISAGVLDANHPALSVSDDGRIVAVFEGRPTAAESGWGPRRAYFVDIGEGRTTEPAVLARAAESVSYPVVAAGTAGRSFVAWSESDGEKSNVLLLRGRRRE
jgi:hypothetical protein